ncbi:aminotransferase [Aspergillus oleicola]
MPTMRTIKKNGCKVHNLSPIEVRQAVLAASDNPFAQGGRIFRLADNITRLKTSCAKIRLKLPLPREELKSILVEVVAKSGIRDAFVEIIVTRSLKALRRVMEPEAQPTSGSVINARMVRRTPPSSMEPTVKNLQWDGLINILYAPSRGVLDGVTRKSVIDACRVNGYEILFELVPVQMAYDGDEIFMCTNAGGIVLITSLDKEAIRDGMVGPVAKKIWDTYWAMHYDDAYSFEIKYEEKEARL